MQVRLRDLEVVAEDLIELDLQRTNLRALAFALLDLRNGLTAVVAEIAQIIQLCINAFADDVAVGQR